jgi:choline dehydrogenase-like flavoprotein
MTSPQPQNTDFTRDAVGRYVFNGLDEALASMDTTRRPEARPFDTIVVGGGTFGSAIAQHLLFQDHTRSHRILVLEAGPFLLPEHVQNMPMIGLNVPGATSIAELRRQGIDGFPRNEVWGLAWHSATPFPGLAYCVGGRSIYFGGWSPRLLDAEMPTAGTARNPWPAAVVHDLTARDGYFDQSARQIGINETNDFIFGPLHTALRRRLYDGLKANQVTDAIDPDTLPTHLDDVPGGEEGLWNLEAPLAVQARTRPGFFPFNKFSAMTLLIKACRAAWAESSNDDVKKRLMVVPNCHVRRLVTSGTRVTGVEVGQYPWFVPLAPNGQVIIATATVESARLALLSFGGTPHAELIGRNLMAHLRSNMTIRIPRSSLPVDPVNQELQASALFVKGRHRYSDGALGHFHLQITAAGLGPAGADSEAELFKKVPDIDTFDQFKTASDTHVVITLRGIGEMEPQDPSSFVRLDPETDEYGLPRAFAAIAPSAKDLELWDAMDRAADEAAGVFAAGGAMEVLQRARDGLGTTHHEAGVLWMGDDPASSVTDGDGRFHGVDNAYVAGPALFPSLGSPNPMLTGVALARRTADRILAATAPPLPALPKPFRYLFDGTEGSLKGWQFVGQGGFVLVDGTLVGEPGGDLGLLYYTSETFGDFTLRLQFRLDRLEDNSGVFVRFRDPHLPVPDRTDPSVAYPYQNQAWVAVTTGLEVQIDELARGDPPGLDQHRTGAIYGIPIGQGPGEQIYRRGPILNTDDWNDYEVQVKGHTYTVRLNGQTTAVFRNSDPFRGKAPADDAHSGFIGLQAHTGRVAFRNICVGPPVVAVPEAETAVGAPEKKPAEAK